MPSFNLNPIVIETEHQTTTGQPFAKAKSKGQDKLADLDDFTLSLEGLRMSHRPSASFIWSHTRVQWLCRMTSDLPSSVHFPGPPSSGVERLLGLSGFYSGSARGPAGRTGVFSTEELYYLIASCFHPRRTIFSDLGLYL